VLSGVGYPSGMITRASTGMGKVLYPHAGTGAVMGKLFLSGCGYGMAIPVGYVPVAILTTHRS
jgi:hypothetical protein